MAHPVRHYNKPARSPADLLTHLRGRGLAVPNQTDATVALNRIGYYRLLIYMRPLQDANKTFLPGITFDDILTRYNFDRALRLHCLDAIERIEVALRAAIINELSVLHGPHFHISSRHFETVKGYREFLDRAIKAHYLGVKHYHDTYDEPFMPPIWTILEGVSYGTLSRMFSNLNQSNRRSIAAQFNYPEPTIVSWFRSMNNLRNMCAHHNRLWNFVMQVDQPMKHRTISDWGTTQNRFYARAVVIVALLNEIDPNLTWKQDLVSLIRSYPNLNAAEMGFPAGWDARPLWR